MIVPRNAEKPGCEERIEIPAGSCRGDQLFRNLCTPEV
jgi:hypothetical protein